MPTRINHPAKRYLGKTIGGYKFTKAISINTESAYVYKGIQLSTGREVAIKLFTNETKNNPVRYGYLKTELQLHKMLSGHPNIVELIETVNVMLAMSLMVGFRCFILCDGVL